MLVDYESGSPREALQHSRKSLKQAPRATEERSQGSPANTPFLPLNFKNILVFALFGLRNPRGNTNAPQKIINFCTFSAYFEPFCPVAGGPDAPEGIKAGPRNGSPPPPNKTRNTTGPAAPMLPECSRCR